MRERDEDISDGRTPEYVAELDRMIKEQLERGWVPPEPEPEPELPSLDEAIDTLFARYGQERTARLVGVSRRTIRRWRAGEGAKQPAARARREMLRREASKVIQRAIPRDRLRQIERAKTIEIKWKLTYSGRTDPLRTTTFTVGGDDANGTTLLGTPMPEVVARYTAERPDLAFPIFDAMEDWYAKVFFRDGNSTAEVLGIHFAG